MKSYLVVQRYWRLVMHLTICLIACIGLVLVRDGLCLWGNTESHQDPNTLVKPCVTLHGDYRFKRYVDLLNAVHNMPIAEACAIHAVRIQRAHNDYVVHIV